MSDRNNIETTRHWPHGILTVGTLRAIMADLDDHVQVVIATGPDDAEEPDWYRNVEQVASPGPGDEQSEYQCLTLFVGDVFDSRQL